MTMSDLPIPGSILLVDTTRAKDSENEIVLSPAPSNDSNDPLRWSFKRKQIANLMLVLYTTTVGISCTSLYSCLVPISEATDIPVATLNAGTGYMFLLLGWGGLLTQPLALTFGKRPVYLISQLGSIVGVVIWMAYVKSGPEWLANKVIQGLVASPIEMLIEVSIGDIFYAHERGWYMGLYAFVLFGSNYVAPMIAGWINQLHGYRWVFYFSAIQQAIGLLISLLFMEETNFNRGVSEMDDDMAVAAHTQPTLGDVHGEKGGPDAAIITSVTSQVSLEGVPFTATERMQMFNRKWATMGQMLEMVYRPILLLRFPCVFWAGFAYGSALVWYNVLNATASLILSSAPYNWASGFVGLSYIGPLIGVLVAGFYSGWIGDKYNIYLARRKNGVREPEDRLWLMSVNVLLVPAGLILWGVGAANQIHWFGLVFGGGLVACSSAIGAAGTLTYAIDCYKDLAGEVMISVILVRNTLSFAIGYGITPWISNLGLQNAFISAAMIGLAISASFFLVVKMGKKWRGASREVYWRYVGTRVGGH